MKESIQNLGPIVLNQALSATKGRLNPTSPIGSETDFTSAPITILGTAKADWATKVDSIEAPFAPGYDKEEYDANSALTLMGFNELRFMLRSVGVPTPDQTSFSEQPLANQKSLVVGTGPGREVVCLSSLGSEVEGLDLTKEYLDVTTSKVEEAGKLLGRKLPVELYQCPAESFDYKPESYDNVSSLFGVLNHVEDWKGTIKKIGESLKPNGMFVSSYYGSNEALVFKLMNEGKLQYAPSILVRRVNGGIKLGDTEEILPANFPYPEEIAQTLEEAGLTVQRRIGSLRLASLFPKEPTPGNIEQFLKLVGDIDEEALGNLEGYRTNPDSLLLATFLYDRMPKNQQNINDYAYVAFSARKENKNG